MVSQQFSQSGHSLPVFDGCCETEVGEAELATEPALSVVVQQLGVAPRTAIELKNRGSQVKEPTHLHQLATISPLLFTKCFHENLFLLHRDISLLVLLQPGFQHL